MNKLNAGETRSCLYVHGLISSPLLLRHQRRNTSPLLIKTVLISYRVTFVDPVGIPVEREKTDRVNGHIHICVEDIIMPNSEGGGSNLIGCSLAKIVMGGHRPAMPSLQVDDIALGEEHAGW